MLRISKSVARIRKCRASDEAMSNKFGGFHDPWFADSEYTNAQYEMTKEHYQFPQFNRQQPRVDSTGKGYIKRPTEPEVWEQLYNRLGNVARPFHQYTEMWHGHAPKPNWLLTQNASGTRRGATAGSSAKVVWKPPGKGQRQKMQATGRPEVPPYEFMEEYTRVNETYKDEMKAMTEYLFKRFVEPTIVEEEAIAQIRILIHKVEPDLSKAEDKLALIKEANAQIPVTELPMRHSSFINWWRFIDCKRRSDQGRGQKIVKAIMTNIFNQIESMDELDLITKYNFDTIEKVSLDDLDQRLEWNAKLNEEKNASSVAAVEEAEENVRMRHFIEDQKFEVLREEEDRVRREEFEKLVQDSEHFIYPENLTSRVLEGLQNPTTHNHPLAADSEFPKTGFPGKPLITTIENKFRVALLEQDYITRDRLIDEGKITNPEEDAQFLTDLHAEREAGARDEITRSQEEENLNKVTAYSTDK